MEETGKHSKIRINLRGRRDERACVKTGGGQEEQLPDKSQFPEVIASLATSPENIEILCKMIDRFPYGQNLEAFAPFIEFAVQNSSTDNADLLEKLLFIIDSGIDSRYNSLTEEIFGAEDLLQSLLGAFPE